MNIEGKWQGVITYGESYGDDKGRNLYFEIEIEQYGVAFDAIAIDISGYGMNPEPADIHGEIIGNQITFTKQYRAFGIVGMPIDRSQPGKEILYSGKFDNSVGHFTGKWKFKPGTYKYGGQYFESGGEGEWMMQRI